RGSERHPPHGRPVSPRAAHEKGPGCRHPGPSGIVCATSRLDRLHFVSLQALLALHDLEGHLLAFLQRLEAGALDRTEVDEEVLAAFRGDEAEALGVVEPLDGTGLTFGHVATP